jgi:flavorubredoxin
MSDVIDMTLIMDQMHGPAWRLDQARRKDAYADWCDEQARTTGWYHTYWQRAEDARREAAQLRATYRAMSSAPRTPVDQIVTVGRQ